MLGRHAQNAGGNISVEPPIVRLYEPRAADEPQTSISTCLLVANFDSQDRQSGRFHKNYSDQIHPGGIGHLIPINWATRRKWSQAIHD
jgi:hypothetical protein